MKKYKLKHIDVRKINSGILTGLQPADKFVQPRASSVLRSSLLDKVTSMREEEDYIEKLITAKRSEFTEEPSENHLKKFIWKMNHRVRHLINIVPYLVKVALVTVVIFLASILCFKNYIVKEPAFIKLQVKIFTEVTKLIRPD